MSDRYRQSEPEGQYDPSHVEDESRRRALKILGGLAGAVVTGVIAEEIVQHVLPGVGDALKGVHIDFPTPEPSSTSRPEASPSQGSEWYKHPIRIVDAKLNPINGSAIYGTKFDYPAGTIAWVESP